MTFRSDIEQNPPVERTADAAAHRQQRSTALKRP
jgi:hypothetical protein